jgi:hypothetical protein
MSYRMVFCAGTHKDTHRSAYLDPDHNMLFGGIRTTSLQVPRGERDVQGSQGTFLLERLKSDVRLYVKSCHMFMH